MAGSYNHVVNKETGALRKSPDVQGMLECRSGDVFEAVEEMYGMIWWLADQLAEETHGITIDPKDLIDAARVNYKDGLALSPTKRYKKESNG